MKNENEKVINDSFQGIFNTVEHRWESGSRGLMHLMEFSLECLKMSLKFGENDDLKNASEYLNMSSTFVTTGAILMKTFGNIDILEYNKFRDTRDIHGSDTDKRLIDLHVEQKTVLKDLLRFFFYTLSVNKIDSKMEISNLAREIKNLPLVFDLTNALIFANDAHKDVFKSHTWVCEKVVEKNEASIRGNYIGMFQNRDFLPLLVALKDEFDKFKN